MSPHTNKNNLITVTVLYKIYHLVTKILAKDFNNMEELPEAEKQSLEYARQQRTKYGYKVINNE